MLAEVGATFLAFSPVVRRIALEEGCLCSTSPSLTAVVAVKSTATLLRRTGSIKLYRAWFLTTGFTHAAFFTERTVVNLLFTRAFARILGAAPAR